MKKKNFLETKKHIEKRYGINCKHCGTKLSTYRLDGVIDGKSVSFCSFDCHDKYIDSTKTKKEGSN